jgi:large subunit ribosomal protein L16
MKKIHKRFNVYKETNKRASSLKGGIIGLKSMGYAQISLNQIESARKYISRSTKRNCKLLIRIKNNIPISKKSIGSRMGKGKGIITEYVCNLKKGTVIFEIFTSTIISNMMLQKILLVISKKLSITIAIFSKNIKGLI